MNKWISVASGILLALVGLAAGPASAVAQDSARVAPKNVKVVLENHRLRVLEVNIKPGEKIPMHTHPPHLTIALSPIKGKYLSPDGKSVVAEAKPEAIQWNDGITHASENVGTTHIHAYVIELKDPPRRKTSK